MRWYNVTFVLSIEVQKEKRRGALKLPGAASRVWLVRQLRDGENYTFPATQGADAGDARTSPGRPQKRVSVPHTTSVKRRGCSWEGIYLSPPAAQPGRNASPPLRACYGALPPGPGPPCLPSRCPRPARRAAAAGPAVAPGLAPVHVPPGPRSKLRS